MLSYNIEKENGQRLRTTKIIADLEKIRRNKMNTNTLNTLNNSSEEKGGNTKMQSYTTEKENAKRLHTK